SSGCRGTAGWKQVLAAWAIRRAAAVCCPGADSSDAGGSDSVARGGAIGLRRGVQLRRVGGQGGPGALAGRGYSAQAADAIGSGGQVATGVLAADRLPAAR